MPLAGRDPVATAVRRVAQVGPSPADAVGVVARPVTGAPLPHVAGRVVQAEPVGREGVHRTGAAPAVGAGVVGGERALPDVHPVLPVRLELGTPGKLLAHQAAAGGVLPLGLGRQPDPAPRGVRLCVGARHVHDGVLLQPGQPGLRPDRVRPGSAEHFPPPRRLDHATRGREVVGEQPGEDERRAEPLGVGPVTGGGNEGGELVVRHRAGRDLVRRDVDLADRPLLRVVGVLTADQRRAAREGEQRWRRRTLRPGRHRSRRSLRIPGGGAAAAH